MGERQLTVGERDRIFADVYREQWREPSRNAWSVFNDLIKVSDREVALALGFQARDDSADAMAFAMRESQITTKETKMTEQKELAEFTSDMRMRVLQVQGHVLKWTGLACSVECGGRGDGIITELLGNSSLRPARIFPLMWNHTPATLKADLRKAGWPVTESRTEEVLRWVKEITGKTAKAETTDAGCMLHDPESIPTLRPYVCVPVDATRDDVAGWCRQAGWCGVTSPEAVALQSRLQLLFGGTWLVSEDRAASRWILREVGSERKPVPIGWRRHTDEELSELIIEREQDGNEMLAGCKFSAFDASVPAPVLKQPAKLCACGVELMGAFAKKSQCGECLLKQDRKTNSFPVTLYKHRDEQPPAPKTDVRGPHDWDCWQTETWES